MMSGKFSYSPTSKPVVWNMKRDFFFFRFISLHSFVFFLFYFIVFSLFSVFAFSWAWDYGERSLKERCYWSQSLCWKILFSGGLVQLCHFDCYRCCAILLLTSSWKVARVTMCPFDCWITSYFWTKKISSSAIVTMSISCSVLQLFLW